MRKQITIRNQNKTNFNFGFRFYKTGNCKTENQRIKGTNSPR